MSVTGQRGSSAQAIVDRRETLNNLEWKALTV